MMLEYKWSGAPVVSVSEFPRKWTLLEYLQQRARQWEAKKKKKDIAGMQD